MSVLNDNGDGTTSTLISAMDANMIKFQTVTSIASDQVLRYSRWDTRGPLWVSNKNTLVAENISNCFVAIGHIALDFQHLTSIIHFQSMQPIATFLLLPRHYAKHLQRYGIHADLFLGR